MGKYIKYERIAGFYTNEKLNEEFKKIIANGQEIIYYHEVIMDKDSIKVVIVCAKLNEGVEFLKS